MNSRVVSSRFPYLPLTLEVRDVTYQVDALLDTGFDGFVLVPGSATTRLGPADFEQRWRLADGSVVMSLAYRGEVHVGNLGPIDALITALGEEALVGRGVSDRFTVILDHGRQLIVEP